MGQVIVVADRCNDATALVSQGYADQVVEIECQDKGSAMAVGLACVGTPDVLFLDADLEGLQPGHVQGLCTVDPQGGQVVGIRADTPPLLRSAPIPSLSGDRRLPTALARTVPLAGSGWRAEVLLNAAVGRTRTPWRHLLLRGVTNPTKLTRQPGAWAGEMVDVAGAVVGNLPALLAYSLHPGG